MKKISITILLIFGVFNAFSQKQSQKVILKSNLAAIAIKYPSIAFETGILKHNSLVIGFSRNIRKNFPDKFLWVDFRQYILSKNKLKGAYLAPGYFVGYGIERPLHSIGCNAGFQVYNSTKNKHLVLDLNAGMYKNLRPLRDSFLDFYPKLTIGVGYIFGK